MLRCGLFFLLFLAQPFWETKPPEEWTEKEIDTIRFNSPWAQPVGPEPKVLAYLATAQPIEDAEAELRIRGRNQLGEPDADYLTFLSERRENCFVLAIPYRSPAKFTGKEELRRMEEESVMLIGREKHRLIGHFPPVPADPVLRLVFPKEIQPTGKTVIFRVYLPGVEFPDREVEFTLKDMLYRGKLAM
jgi:hypothetical protein